MDTLINVYQTLEPLLVGLPYRRRKEIAEHVEALVKTELLNAQLRTDQAKENETGDGLAS